jgi:glycosyltransferase involved in cell wall biosynthesis
MEYNSQSQPLVTIGVLSYNRGHRIGETIESILRQGYTNLEILISDDASDDNNETVEACQKYIERDKRITLFVQKINIGPYHNYEFLVSQAHGEYFMWMSDDDELNPSIIGRYVDFLESNPDYSLVSGKILHWKNGELAYVEKNLSLETISDYSGSRIFIQRSGREQSSMG